MIKVLKKNGAMKRIALLVIMLLSLAMFSLSAQAATAAQDGIEVTMTTDKTSYVTGETVIVNLTVTNRNTFALDNVRLDITPPEGLRLQSGSVITIASLAPGATQTHAIQSLAVTTGDGTQANTPGDGTQANTPGDASSPLLWALLLALLAGGLAGLLYFKKRRAAKFLSLFLCLGFVATLAAPLLPARAATVVKDFTVSETVAVDGAPRQISVKISYEWDEANDTAAGTRSFNIVHWNDVHSYAEETSTSIGYAKIAGFAQQVKQNDPNTLILDAGDVFGGTPLASMDKGESLVSVLNTMGIDAMTAGNHEFYLGTDQLQKLKGMINYPMLGGNILWSASSVPVLEEYKIFTLPNGLKIGVFGVTSQDCMRGQADISYETPVARANRIVPQLKPQVDVVVGLVHLGDNTVLNTDTSLVLARQVAGIDVLVDGHSHTVLPNGHVENGVLIAQAGEYGKYLGLLKVTVGKDGVQSATSKLYDKAASAAFPEKAETKAAMDTLLAGSNAYLSAVVGSTSVQFDGDRNTVRTKETAVGNMYADAMRAGTGADLAIFSAGCVGGENAPGPLTRRDVMSIDRAGVSVRTLSVKGSDIAEVLYYCMRGFPDATVQNAYQAQVSGIKFEVDASKAPYNTVSPSTNAAEGRIVNIRVDGVALEPDKFYTVATYGDYVFLFTDMQSVSGSTTVLKDWGDAYPMLEKYVTDNSPVAPVVEGRYTAINVTP